MVNSLHWIRLVGRIPNSLFCIRDCVLIDIRMKGAVGAV